ncbi:MAG: MurR/RpiR family transcriptional regulator [Acidobacteriaceae bacterium]
MTKSTSASIKAEAEIARNLESLSTQQREFILQTFERPGDYVLLSLRQVARKLGVDPSTFLRWLRVVGFHQYAEFRAYLHERSITQATSIEALEKTPHDTGLPALVRNSIQGDLKNLHALENLIEPARLLTLARKLWSARRIVILAGDMSASLGVYLEYTLSMIGFDATNAATPGEMVHRTRSVQKSDVVIAITYGRGHIYTIGALTQAARKGAFCAGISDSYLSPIAELCNEFFITPTDRVSFATSYTSAMAFVNAVLVVIASLRKQSLYPLLQEISEEQRTGDRFYQRNRVAERS